MRVWQALLIAFSSFSRVPVPQADWTEENRRLSMCFFPAVGLVCGAAAGLWLYLCGLMQAGAFLRGAGCAVLVLAATGGIHMDGFMDTTDALSSWRPKEKRLEILHDSHVGAFAVMACAGYLLAEAAFLSEADVRLAPSLAAVFVLSRALSALALTLFPKARKDGMLQEFASVSSVRTNVFACGLWGALAAVTLLVISHACGALALLAAGLVFAYYRNMSEKYFGGITGDLAGWFLQTAELACIAVLILGGKLL